MFEFGPMLALRISRKQETEDLFAAIGDNFFMNSTEEGWDQGEVPLSAEGVKQVFADLFYEGYSVAITADFDIEGSRNFFHNDTSYTLLCVIVHISTIPETYCYFKNKDEFYYLKGNPGNFYLSVMIFSVLY
jgi:hypothetical protein